MSGTGDIAFLTGKLLIAMPGIGDPRFERSVIYMCSHSEEAAMGLMLSRSAPDLSFAELLSQLEIEIAPGVDLPDILIGGPVERSRGFVLHSDDYALEEGTLPVDGHIAMTASVEILRDMARGIGPVKALLALGYSGWGPGQLETEIRANGWLTCDADPGIVFDVPVEARWQSALARLGIEVTMLSREGGVA